MVGVIGIFLLLALLLSLGGLAYLWVRVFVARSSGLPACGACGYLVRGATGFISSECGADFREVGITSPKSGHGVSWSMFAVLWTMCLPIPLLVAVGILSWVGPSVNTYQSNFDLESVHVNELEAEIHFSSSGTTLGAVREVRRVGAVVSRPRTAPIKRPSITTKQDIWLWIRCNGQFDTIRPDRRARSLWTRRRLYPTMNNGSSTSASVIRLRSRRQRKACQTRRGNSTPGT